METELGIIQIELYPEKAPITSANFLQYIDEKRYQNAYFYRVVHMKNQPENNIKIEVIQGGLGSENNSEEHDDYPDSLVLACRAVNTGDGWHVLDVAQGLQKAIFG